MSTLKDTISLKTDDELRHYIENTENHPIATVLLATQELQSRSVGPQATELHENDLALPAYYSPTAIYCFSIFFTPVFGAFLIASDLKTTGKPQLPVIICSIGYLFVSGFILDHFSLSGPTEYFISCGLGAVLIHELFWKRAISPDTNYQLKPVLKPFLIGIGIVAGIFIVSIVLNIVSYI